MVFMAVGDEDTTDTVFFVVEVTGIRDNEIDTEHFFIGEHHPGINNDDIIAIFDDHHVLSDFPQSSQLDESNIFCCQGKKNLLYYTEMCSSIAVTICFYISSLLSSPQKLKPK